MPTPSSSKMKLESDAFKEGGNIPAKYTCDGPEISPPLKISGVPEGTKSLALILEDPDASSGTFVHWILFNISPEITVIDREMPLTSPTEGIPGKNGAGTTDYLGPCPPSGVHRYIFTLYALDTVLKLTGGATQDQLVFAMHGHVLAEARLMSRYGREH